MWYTLPVGKSPNELKPLQMVVDGTWPGKFEALQEVLQLRISNSQQDITVTNYLQKVTSLGCGPALWHCL
jgi:hypothetical protein